MGGVRGGQLLSLLRGCVREGERLEGATVIGF